MLQKKDLKQNTINFSKENNFFMYIKTSEYCGTNSLLVEINDVKVYYSYRTPIAVEKGGQLMISLNEWTRTTGKHLRAIDDISERVPHKILMMYLESINV